MLRGRFVSFGRVLTLGLALSASACSARATGESCATSFQTTDSDCAEGNLCVAEARVATTDSGGPVVCGDGGCPSSNPTGNPQDPAWTRYVCRRICDGNVVCGANEACETVAGRVDVRVCVPN